MAAATSIASPQGPHSPSTARASPPRLRAPSSNIPNITVVRERVDACPDHPTSSPPDRLRLEAREAIAAETGEGALAFFDAIAPIVHRDSIDMDVAWMAARWERAGRTISTARSTRRSTTPSSSADRRREDAVPRLGEGHALFRGLHADRGDGGARAETLRYGPMKGVGLDNPRTGRWPYAVVQLRQDNALGTLWNMVGFQTKLKHGEQVRIFRTIPGFENAEFARLGGIHRTASSTRPPARPRASPEVEAQHPLRRADHRLRRLCRKRRRSASLPRASPPPSFAANAAAAAARNRAWRAPRPHHRRRGRRDVPADERQFRPDAAAPEGRRKPTASKPTPTAPAGLAPGFEQRVANSPSCARARASAVPISCSLLLRRRRRGRRVFRGVSQPLCPFGALELVDRLHRPFLERQLRRCR